MSGFFRELLRASIYKRSQGRITRQVTFAAVIVAIALGLWRLGTVIEPLVDPLVVAKPASVTCTLPGNGLDTDGKLRITGSAGAAEVPLHKGDDRAAIADAVNREQKATGVVADIPETTNAKGPENKGRSRGEKTLVLSSGEEKGAEYFVRVEATPAGLLQFAGINHEGEARGIDKVNLGLHFLIPVVLLAACMWVCYRLVNLPAFADFLIAVEAEMNKVSWPTRPELFRASAVVLIVIFAMMLYLAVCDLVWGGLVRQLLLRGT